ncbi:MAG: ORF6C domain-containing protein [Pseudolactococcus laudensis]
MSTPTATMPAPKGNSLEIVYQTLGIQTEQAEALKQVIQEVINTKQEMIEISQKTNERFDYIENTITLRDSECTELQRAVMLKAAELVKEFLDGQSVSQNYYSSKKGQFIRLVYKRIKSRFNVHKYTLVTHVEFGKAMEFVNDIKLNDFSEVETRETIKQLEIKQLEEKND